MSKFMLLIILFALTACAHRHQTLVVHAATNIAYIEIQPGQGVYCSGGSAFIGFPLPADLSPVKREVQDSLIHLRDCDDQCGVYIELVYDDHVAQEELNAALSFTLQQYAPTGVALYVRAVQHLEPRSVHLYAKVSTGVVIPR